MFSFLKSNPVDKLNKQYQRLMKEARDIQRSGDIKAFAAKTAEADAILKKIEEINNEKA
ncbi:MAG: Lacal_2735 family protein [Chitinophagales bacterium]|nr:Lacal_2735 family protein [Chitinophagales bacterium]